MGSPHFSRLERVPSRCSGHAAKTSVKSKPSSRHLSARSTDLGAGSVFVQQQPPHAGVALMKVAVSVFPDELDPPPRGGAERDGAGVSQTGQFQLDQRRGSVRSSPPSPPPARGGRPEWAKFITPNREEAVPLFAAARGSNRQIISFFVPEMIFLGTPQKNRKRFFGSILR